MAVTHEHLNQTVISVEELKHHYSFQLKRVGFPPSKALDMAALMVQPVNQLTHLEESRICDAISVLEEQKAVAPPRRRRKAKACKQSDRAWSFEASSSMLLISCS